MQRRQFLHSSLCLAGGALVASSASAIEPIRRIGKPHLRLSLAAYSYRQYLAPRDKKPTMTLEDFIDLAAQLGVDAVEPTSYYFPKTTQPYLASLKVRCTRLGLDVSGGAVRNDFCLADPGKLKAEIAHVRQWIEHYSLLGAKTIRIFAGNVPRGDTEEAARKRCVEAIEQACDHAAQFGIYLALENHGGITSTAEQLLAIVKAVRHDHFGVNLDSGNFHSADPYAELEKIAPYAIAVQLKTEIRRAGQKKNEEADLSRLVKMLVKTGYRGYVALEYEAAADPRTAIPGHLATLRKLLAS